jgi:hypothetical protein
MKKNIFFMCIALSMFSCLTVDEWETYVWPDTYPETSSTILIGSGVTVNEYNGNKVNWSEGKMSLRFEKKSDFGNVTVEGGIPVMVFENQLSTVVIPSGETTFVMSLFDRISRSENDRVQFYDYRLKSYEFNYNFEKQKVYKIMFFVEESFWFWNKPKWIVQVDNLTDKTNDKIIVKTAYVGNKTWLNTL